MEHIIRAKLGLATFNQPYDRERARVPIRSDLHLSLVCSVLTEDVSIGSTTQRNVDRVLSEQM